MYAKNTWEKYKDNLNEVMEYNEGYKDYISKNKTERACVKDSIRLAKEKGFKPLDSFETLKPGDKVYVNNRDKNIALFVIGNKPLTEGMRILGAHIDSPRMDLKQNPIYESEGFVLADTHYYGGVKKYQWVTIPLSLYGVVAKKDGTVVDVVIGEDDNDPVVGISDLLIHLAAEQLDKKAVKVIEGENLDVTLGNMPLVGEEKDAVKANILKLLKDKNCKLRIFRKEKDLNIYSYFSHRERNYMFSSFNLSKTRLARLDELPLDTKAAVLAKNPCTIFEYTIKNDIQGKTDERNGIFFKIPKIEIICFNTGICFLCIKTNIEGSNKFSDVLNFNYKFRDINQEFLNMNNYDNIRVQTDCFDDVKYFKEFIESLTGPTTESIKLDIDTERFLTFSYVCIDQEAWNSTNEFDKIKHNFIKYANILPADNSRNYEMEKEKIKILSKWKYAKVGLTKLGCTLFSSSSDMNNYTILPDEYENQYFYTYILNLYKKIYLKKLQLKFKNPKLVKKARKEFIDFTKKIWIQEITEDEIGTVLNHRMQETFELEKLYGEVKNKYDVLYKDLNIEKNKTVTILIAVILVASLLFNILNFITLMRQ